MVRIALIGGASAYHCRVFASLLNDYDRAGYAQAGFPHFDRAPLGELTVQAIWDADADEARRVAGLAKIPEVLSAAEDAIGRVDGVIICDDLSMKHQRLAKPFLEAGVPTFIDKPLSPDPAEAAEIAALARTGGAPLMSCSALRYARELAEARERIAALGRIWCATGTAPGELVFYGIHALELVHAVLGPGVEWVQNIGDEERAFVRCAYPNGTSIMLQVLGPEGYPGMHGCFFGERGGVHIGVEDAAAFYGNTLKEFARMVRTREMPIPLDTTLEIIRILTAGKRSQQQGGARIPVNG
jgi:predicted dehydrogenase